jgi:hypothetical protein
MTNGPQDARLTTAPPSDLATVQVLGAPVRVWAKASERYQELLREFALMQFGADAGHQVPQRLLALSRELTGRYAALMADNNARREASLAAGAERIDLTYQVPVQVREVCEQFMQLLNEADDYCRTDQLLTLATPPVQRDFRDWFLGQFVSQLGGAPPAPWAGPLECPHDSLQPD